MDPVHGAPNASPPPSPRRRLSRRGAWIAGVVALLALAGLAWLAWDLTHPATAAVDPSAPRGRRGAPPTTVGVAAAQRADIPVVLEALGTVTPAATVTVRSQVSGVLQKVLFREGQMVKAGQVLAQIDPRPFEMALTQALGQRQRDEAQLENARLTLQRYRTLLQQDSIARQDVDTQAALVKQLEGTLTMDRANEGTARLNLGYSRIVAPASGRLGLRVVDVGNVVTANDANGIAVITQLSPIDVEFSLPQDRVPEVQARLRENAALPVTAFDRTRTTALDSGSFAALDNQVDTQTGTVRAKARLANTQLALFPNQFVNVQLLLRTIQGAVVVPVTALRHGSSGDFVYVLDEAARTVALRTVTAGQSTASTVAINSGLQVGEKVITEGADRLKDGARVMLAGDKPASGAASGTRRGGRAARGASAGAGGDVSAAASGASGAGRRHRRASAPADGASAP